MISGLHRVYNTVLDVILQDDLSGVVDGGFYGRKLDQHFAAVSPVLHHPSDGFQMADGPAEPVQHSLRIGVHMFVAVHDHFTVFIDMCMSMLVCQSNAAPVLRIFDPGPGRQDLYCHILA